MGEQERDYNDGLFSKRVRAGKRRTYFIDVKTTRNDDYYITITESKKRFDDDGYDRHKLFLYKEDFNKFLDAMTEVINHVKKELLPDYDFDKFSHDFEEGEQDKGADGGEEVKKESKTSTSKPKETPQDKEAKDTSQDKEEKDTSQDKEEKDTPKDKEGKDTDTPEDDDELKWE